MLLPLLLNLGFEEFKAPPRQPIIGTGGGLSSRQKTLIRERSRREAEERVQIENSEIIAIVKITLKHFII